MEVRAATPGELPTVLTVLDSSMLETDLEVVREAIEREDLLVAVEEGRILGACLLVGDEIDAIAVRRERRDQDIGTTLVETAAERREQLIAEFDSRVRPFWESLGFDIEPGDDAERYRGHRK